MSTGDPRRAGIDRRGFLRASAAAAGILTLQVSCLRERDGEPAAPDAPRVQVTPVRYGDWTDVWRERWTWDRIAKGTHTRANCIAACAWNVFVRDGVVWREEQDAVYDAPRPDVPDGNPRGCQKGACYSDLQISEARLLHPLKRVGARGAGQWKRISWDEALGEVADGIIDACVAEGSETVVYDHGTTNAGYGPETAGEMRFAEAIQATQMDSWSGVGDMPMGCVQTWGMYNVEGTSDDWFRSNYIVVWVGNPSYTRIPEIHFMHEARYRGARLVVVAPDYNATAVHADLWLNPRAETDAALGLAAAQVIVSEGLHDAESVREQTDLPLLVRDDDGRFLRESDLEAGGREDRLYLWDEARDRLAVAPGCAGDGDGGLSLALGRLRPALEGSRRVRLADGREITVRPVFARLRAHLEDYTPEKAAAITGLSADVIRRFARDLAAAKPAMIFASWGACKHYHSDLFQRAMILLMALTGNVGRPGGGLRVAAWWGLDGLDRMESTRVGLGEILRVLPKAIRGIAPREWEDLYTQHSEKRPITPLMPFLYVHGGYGETWSRPDNGDPALPRGFDAYVREALERGWTQVHPRAGSTPSGVPLHRLQSPAALAGAADRQAAPVAEVRSRRRGELPHEHVGGVRGPRAAGGGLLREARHQVRPELRALHRALGPRGGPARRVEERVGDLRPARPSASRPAPRSAAWSRCAASRTAPSTCARPTTISRRTGASTPPARRPGQADRRHHAQQPERRRDQRRGSAAARRRAHHRAGAAAVRSTRPAATTIRRTPTGPTAGSSRTSRPGPRSPAASSSTSTTPGTWRRARRCRCTRIRRGARSRFPLRINGGHTRWSIHAIWRDHALMLRLQRGEPVLLPRARGLRAARDPRRRPRARLQRRRRLRGDARSWRPASQPGEVIIYHAWEPYQFKDWRGQQEPVEAPWKAIHLAGGYGQLHYRMFYSSPGHAPRGAPVEVERA